jgi:hypothetical protein
MEEREDLYRAISAAWRTGYASSPSFRSASVMEVSSAAFFDTANFDCLSVWFALVFPSIVPTFQVVMRCNLPTGVTLLKYHCSSECSLTYRSAQSYAQGEEGHTSSWK